MHPKQNKRILDWLIAVIKSRNFFIAILVIFFLQASWIAISFRYPMIYDEIFHVPVIEIFSHQFSPFIQHQPLNYDQYGNLANNSAGLFHYLMSFPFRFISYFTDSFPIKVIFIRLLNVTFVTIGLYIFYKLFRRLKVPRLYINSGLLVFTLIPVVPLTAAHVNYDNLLFPLAALYILLSVDFLLAKKSNLIKLLTILLVGIFAALIKVTFLPILFVSFMFLLIFIISIDGKKVGEKYLKQIKSLRNVKSVFVIICLAVLSILFTVKYINNVIVYKNPQPSCLQTLTQTRCLAEQLTQREINAEATKSTRTPMHITEYFSHWYDRMVIYSVMTGGTTNNEIKIGAHSPMMRSLVFFGCIFSIGIILYAWRSMRLSSLTWGYLLLIILVTVASTFIFNYLTYLQSYFVYAIQPRYLLIALPIILVLASMSFGNIFRAFRNICVLVFIAIILLLIQGGGVFVHISLSDSTWYWQNAQLININMKIKTLVSYLLVFKY